MTKRLDFFILFNWSVGVMEYWSVAKEIVDP